VATIPKGSTRISRTRAATAVVAAALLALTACGGGSSSSAGSSGGGSGGTGSKSFIYVTNNPIGTNEFLQLGKKGIEDAASKYNGTSKVYESTDVASQRSNIEAAIAEAPDVIVLITFDFTDLSKEYAEQNPDQQFLLIDACPDAPPANLHCGVFREQEASYLVGIEAGKLTTTKKIGSVGAVDIPFLHRYSDSFAAGAKSVDPAITDSQLWIGGSNPFADPAKGKEQALAMAATGADHVFAIGAGSNGGIFQAATEQNFFSYGVDINQCPMAPGHIVDNTMKAVDVLVVQEIGAILDGTAEPLTSFGLKEGGMDLTSLMPGAEQSQCVVMDHPDVIAAVKQAKQDIIDGKIQVKDPAAG
jgi:basic membrane protein A